MITDFPFKQIHPFFPHQSVQSSAFLFADAQQTAELMITPDPQNSGAIVRAEKSSLVYTCSVKGADPEQDANLRWFNPKGIEVQDASGR